MERELSPRERDALEFVLGDPALAEGEALRAQIPFVRVVDRKPQLPTYVHLVVTPGVAPADCPDGRVPVDTVVESASGEATGFILVWAESGYLSTVEHAWVTDDMPVELPSVDRL